MSCFHPVHGYKRIDNGGIGWNHKDVYSDIPMTVPCGNCIGCVNRSKRDWSIRLQHEAQMHDVAWFVTLTYDDDHVPAGHTLDRTEPPKLIRKLRKRSPGQRISYYAAGEYGDRTHRPHYHMALYGAELGELRKSESGKKGAALVSPLLDELWGKGFVTVAELTPATARYVAGYVQKKGFNKDERDERYERLEPWTGEITSVEPERATMSTKPAIGKRWIEKYWPEAYPSDFVVMGGKEVIPPRYYDRWLEENQPELWREVQRARASKRDLDEYTPERLSVREVCMTAKAEMFRQSGSTPE